MTANGPKGNASTMTTIQSRRRLIVLILLGLAVAGAIVRHYAERGTTTRDIGTLLMVLWVPIIGNVIAWLIGKLPRRAAPAEPAGFDAARAFTPHFLAELRLRPPALPSHDVPLAPGEYRCALVVGNEGFSARWFVPPGERSRGASHMRWTSSCCRRRPPAPGFLPVRPSACWWAIRSLPMGACWSFAHRISKEVGNGKRVDCSPPGN